MDMLEEKENVLHKKILLETERAKEFSKAKNKQGLFKRLGFFFCLLIVGMSGVWSCLGIFFGRLPRVMCQLQNVKLWSIVEEEWLY